MNSEGLRNSVIVLLGVLLVFMKTASASVDAANLPLGIDIQVTPAGMKAPPQTSVLVKTGTPLDIKLCGSALNQAPLNASLIGLSMRQLKQDGSFTEWLPLGAPCQGEECTYTPVSGGIFQLKAIILAHGEKTEIPWLRKQDAAASIDGDGHCSQAGKRGMPEYFGVADTDAQITLCNKARDQIATTTYSKNASLTVPTGSLLGSYTITPGHDKCNAFIYVTANAAGAPVPLTRRNKLFLMVNPPLAYDWYDGSYPITGWEAVPITFCPQPGFVVARPDVSVWNKNDPMYSWNHGQRYAHVGILDYDGSWIQADEKRVDAYPHLTDPKYQPVGMRRYTGN